MRWRVEKDHKKERHVLYRSPNIGSVMKWIRSRFLIHVAIMEAGRNYLALLSAKPIGKRSLGLSRHRWD